MNGFGNSGPGNFAPDDQNDKNSRRSNRKDNFNKAPGLDPKDIIEQDAKIRPSKDLADQMRASNSKSSYIRDVGYENHQKPPNRNTPRKILQKGPPDKKYDNEHYRKLFDFLRGIRGSTSIDMKKIKAFKAGLEKSSSSNALLFLTWTQDLLAEPGMKRLKTLYKKNDDYFRKIQEILKNAQISFNPIKDYNSLQIFMDEEQTENYIACRTLIKLGLKAIPDSSEILLVNKEIKEEHASFLIWIITSSQSCEKSLYFLTLATRQLLLDRLHEIDDILEKKQIQYNDYERKEKLDNALREIEGNHEMLSVSTQESSPESIEVSPSSENNHLQLDYAMNQTSQTTFREIEEMRRGFNPVPQSSFHCQMSENEMNNTVKIKLSLKNKQMQNRDKKIQELPQALEEAEVCQIRKSMETKLARIDQILQTKQRNDFIPQFDEADEPEPSKKVNNGRPNQ